MKSEKIARHFLIPFVIALVGYVIIYSAIENRRNRNGPWQITMTNDVAHHFALVINQPKLGITNLWISFASETTPMTNFGTVTFEQPRETPFEVSFGQCVFMDLTSLPGTLVFDVFGHEIQLMPRVLTIDKIERAWKSDESIVLSKP